jgi:carbamoyltransferase
MITQVDDDTRVVLGLSAGFHDSAAALVVDGEIRAAVEEERLSRVKHDPSFPSRAADTCLAIAGISAADVDAVAFHEKPLGVVGRHLASRIRTGPLGARRLFMGTPDLVATQLGRGHRIDEWFSRRGADLPPLLMAEHHTSHSAAAFYPSPFGDAAIMTIDGVGEWATSTLGEGRGHHIRVDRELRYPDSIGMLYSAFTAYSGFRVNGGEGELMGLAPFGEPRYVDAILDELVDLFEDGSIRLDQRYFAYVRGRRTTTPRFHRLFGGAPRPLGSRPGQREADLALSVQRVTEEIILSMSRELHRTSGLDSVCLAGGVALNCVANGRLAREGPFERVWVQPAAGDAGNAVGAALWAWHEVLGNLRSEQPDDAMSGAFLGPAFSDEEIRSWLDSNGIVYRHLGEGPELAECVAQRLAGGEVVGWFQGRMEFGPRALGHRSIVADPRSPTVQGRLNGLVKERAAFRPFAPAVLEERAADWFDHDGAAPYMTFAAPVREDRRVRDEDGGDTEDLEAEVAKVRSTIPAVTHVDHSARVQTVDRRRNPEFVGLLEAFERTTGCPVLLNTSFNARDEPIVCTPEDAYRTFDRTGLDLLVLGSCLVERT